LKEKNSYNIIALQTMSSMVSFKPALKDFSCISYAVEEFMFTENGEVFELIKRIIL
jgi:hypothetical protein